MTHSRHLQRAAPGDLMNRMIDGYCRALEVLMAVLLALMVVLIVQDIINPIIPF